jgi:hypothetical protein
MDMALRLRGEAVDEDWVSEGRRVLVKVDIVVILWWMVEVLCVWCNCDSIGNTIAKRGFSAGEENKGRRYRTPLAYLTEREGRRWMRTTVGALELSSS